ncbi:MAG: nucleotide exchange factor GrpE [Deltaproteobacteria bacterium RIFCSPLOWO2_02_FULL_44_10]|nr:MAG: nucleotide exchange factor GrpE [Deltaproteobacteria bacterium RIFCSPHIGHO2_02_FULL_44_16]OGQ47562.1 MAG: nucleotide exchange factor GrpE [Deltaproteobacteria bacterium RIFCSPLOWO2_02_FULL_44_10]
MKETKEKEIEKDGAEEEQFTADLHAAEQEAKKHYEKLLRVMADFENYKKRTSKEIAERTKYANEDLLKVLLPALDGLGRVLDHVTPESSDEAKNIGEGVNLVMKDLFAALSKFDLREVEALHQPFNPEEHEAVSTVMSDEVDPDTVISVHRKGYRLGDRLLRPAMVTVSKKE